jgi:hypothetical protein
MFRIPVYNYNYGCVDHVTETTIVLDDFTLDNPQGRQGELFMPNLIVISDLNFTIIIDFPVRRGINVKINTKNPLTLRQLLYTIQRIYLHIYETEEKTATPTEFRVHKQCDCSFLDSSAKLLCLHSAEEKEDNCSICYTPLSENTVLLNCKHVFHRNCMQQWIDTGRSNSCPLCRGNLHDCNRCNNTKIITNVEQHIVLPRHLRTDVFRDRNSTNGIFGIHTYDFEQLELYNMVYNSEQKILKLKIYGKNSFTDYNPASLIPQLDNFQ